MQVVVEEKKEEVVKPAEVAAPVVQIESSSKNEEVKPASAPAKEETKKTEVPVQI